MSNIRVLDKHLQNKIAAGEVVDRPSAVVKELVENSIDAHATEIQISIEESGLNSIRIIDNGDGIYKEDAALIFERHATSKLTNDHDLFQVRNLGFRGEALASIGAVSQCTLESFNVDSAPFKIEYKGGETFNFTDGKERRGTDILIEHLFYNTPARYKYIRSLNTESGKIIDIVSRLAMSHPNIRFTLMLDGRMRIETKGNGNLKEVIADIYGLNIAKHVMEVSLRNQDFSITGYVVKPEINRSNRNYISISLNNRHIRDFHLSQSIINAFHTMLPKNKFPIAVINIEMDPQLVDVNVHPTKLQVKISKDKELIQLLETAIKNTLIGETLIPRIEIADIEEKSSREDLSKPVQDSINFTVDETVNSESFTKERPLERKIYTSEERLTYTKDSKEIENDEVKVKEENKERLPYFEIIGQLHGTYIVLQNETGMYLMDQHAAEERIKYEHYYYKLDNNNESTELLVPFHIDFPSTDVIYIDQKLDELKSIGFDIEKTGANLYTITSYPTWINRDKLEEEIKEVIEYILDKETFDIYKYREELSIMLSCKKAIKANRYLNHSEIEALINNLRKCHSPFTCPHGRPVVIHYNIYDIEKQFNRIMK